MKHINILAIGGLMAASLSACVSEQQPWEEGPAGHGTTSIQVETLQPTTTRSVDTSDFPVSVVNATTGEEVKFYRTASEVPNQVVLPVGNYYAEAHTPGTLKKIMEMPYYLGRDEFEILQKINTRSHVVCRMANGSIRVALSQEFTDVFTTWTISVDDGTGSAVTFTNTQGANPDVVYLQFAENVDRLTVNFVGTTATGTRISASNVLTKQAASEQYDRDDNYFAGGDAILINFSPVESTEGEITNIQLTAQISFEETEEQFYMEVEDKKPEDDGDEPGPGPDPGDDPTPGGEANITLSLPQNMIITDETAASLGDTYISAEAGIKSIVVTIASTNEDMVSALDQMILQSYPTLDFMNGAEIVDNTQMGELMATLEQQVDIPSLGDKDFTFPIGNFFSMLTVMPGDHSFTLVVTDMNGATKSGTIVLTVEEKDE